MLVLDVTRSELGNEYTVYDELGSKYIVSFSELQRLSIPFTGMSSDYPIEFDDSIRDALSLSHQKLKCVKYLRWYIDNYGEKSKRRLSEKCRENDYSAEVIQYALALLEEYSVIDETRSCRGKIYLYARDKLFGKYRIRQELYNKGYAKKSIEDAFCDCEVDFFENACKMYQKITRGKSITDIKEKKKIAEKMVRYGYSFEEIKYASECEYDEQ